MKYVISGAYHNYVNNYRRDWFRRWALWTYNRQLASGGSQRGGKGRKK